MVSLEDWIKDYLEALPSDRRILAQVEGKWRENSLNAFNRWRHTGGEAEHWEYMEFCDRVLELLETRQ